MQPNEVIDPAALMESLNGLAASAAAMARSMAFLRALKPTTGVTVCERSVYGKETNTVTLDFANRHDANHFCRVVCALLELAPAPVPPT